MCQGPGPRKFSRATAAKAASTCGSPTPAARRDLLRIGPPDDLQFALAIHLDRIWLVRRSGQDSTAFECRVLGANRNPVADPMPAETMRPLSELDRMLTPSDTALQIPPEARGGDAVPDHRSLRENANNLKRTRNTKAQKSWSSRAEPEVRIHLPPAGSQERTARGQTNARSFGYAPQK